MSYDNTYFESEIRNGYLWTDKLVPIKPVHGFSVAGRAGWPKWGQVHRAWLVYRDWYINHRLRQTIISELSNNSITRQAVNLWFRMSDEDMTDAFCHRNLLFIATRTPPIEEDNDMELDVLPKSRLLKLSVSFGVDMDVVLIAWKARQLLKKYSVEPLDSWFPYIEPDYSALEKAEKRRQAREAKKSNKD